MIKTERKIERLERERERERVEHNAAMFSTFCVISTFVLGLMSVGWSMVVVLGGAGLFSLLLVTLQHKYVCTQSN